MFVIENRNRATTVFKDPHNPFEPPVARVKRLAHFVAGVAPVLADNQNAIHRECSTPQGQGLFDRWIDRDVETLRTLARQIPFRKLVHIKPGQVHRRMMPRALPPISFEKTIDEMLRVRMGADLGGEDRDAPATTIPGVIMLRRGRRATARYQRQTARRRGRTGKTRHELTPR